MTTVEGTHFFEKDNRSEKIKEKGSLGEHDIASIESKFLDKIYGKTPPKKQLTGAEKLQNIVARIVSLMPSLLFLAPSISFAMGATAFTVVAIIAPITAPILFPMAVVFGGASATFLGLSVIALIVGAVSRPIIGFNIPESERLLEKKYTNFESLLNHLKTFSLQGVDKSILAAILKEKTIYLEARESFEQKKEVLEKKIDHATKELSKLKEMANTLDKVSEKESKEYNEIQEEIKTINKEVEITKSEIKDTELEFNKVKESCFNTVEKVCVEVLENYIKQEFEKEYEGEKFDNFLSYKLHLYQERKLSMLSLGLYMPLQA